ncbi:hypothetical protein [Sporosarcina sp. NPDC096371]|uniref:hypothetical protein n=1 Tax=Sporosarcina sp. NPDC096371 TaxID=3364530 RepID=UPI00381B1E62
MGLFMNSDEHPDVFKNDAAIVAQNQGHSKIDTLAEWMQEQQEANASLNRHISDLEMLLKQQTKNQSNQLNNVRNRVKELQDNDSRHGQFEKNVSKSLTKLDKKQQELHQILEDKHAVDKEFKMQVDTISESTNNMAVKMTRQLDQQQQLAKLILRQENAQKDVISRLVNQEGVTEKMGRQLDHLRSLLYERTNVLTEKLEHSYTMTAAYLAKLLANAEQPMARFWMNPKSEEKQEKTD